jgi:hypothetical protein
MKTLTLILLLTIPFISKAQLTTIDPDTVCYRSNSAIYEVHNVAGETYTWTIVAPGLITSEQGTNHITVNWSAANPGLIPNGVTVFATNAAGCPGPAIDLDVFVLNIIPTITQIGPYCVNVPCVTLTGTPLGGTWSGIGINGNQFCPPIAGVGTHLVTYIYSLAGCTFTINSSILVNALPTISPIQHN